jgi:hypothetical protein
MEDTKLKSNPAFLWQKQLRNKKIEAKRNSETLFFLKRNETERKKFRNGTKRNKKNSETERNGTKKIQKRNETYKKKKQKRNEK